METKNLVKFEDIPVHGVFRPIYDDERKNKGTRSRFCIKTNKIEINTKNLSFKRRCKRDIYDICLNDHYTHEEIERLGCIGYIYFGEIKSDINGNPTIVE